MKIELELKIKEDEEEVDPDNSLVTIMTTVKDKERHEVLFSSESSSLYSCVRTEACYEYDYEINQIRFGEENDEEFMYINRTTKIRGDRYFQIDPEENLYDSIYFPYSGDPKILNNRNVSCEYCKYQDICYHSEKNYVYLDSKGDDLDA